MSNQDLPVGGAPETEPSNYKQTLILITVAIIAAIVLGFLFA